MPRLSSRRGRPPAALLRWWGPPKLPLIECSLDLRIGGTYRFVHGADDGSRQVFTGTYQEIRRPTLLRYTTRFEPWPESAVDTVTFAERDGRTLIACESQHPSFASRDRWVHGGMEHAHQEREAMRKLIEATHVSLGGEVGAIDWAFSYLDDEHQRYASELLATADALLLGRKTYQGLSAAYPQMENTAEGQFRDFVHRMNTLPKHVVTTSLSDLEWNARPLSGDIVEAVRALKAQPGENIIKFGTGPLDALLLEHRLVDEYHFWLTPVAVPASVQPLFQAVQGAPTLVFREAIPFRSGVVALRYSPTPPTGT